MADDSKLKRMGLSMSIVLFGIPSVVFFLITRVLIPYFRENSSIHPILVWFIFGGLFLFVPLFALALILFKNDKYDFVPKTFTARFRLGGLDAKDWVWSLGAFLLIFISMGAIMGLWKLLSLHVGLEPLDTTAPFLQFTPLRGAEVLFLLIWIPFFFFNIVGEELLWRGYILPRQELAFGKSAWFINGILWTFFHLFFGFHLMILLLPSLFIIPYVVYKRKKTLIGIIVHALLNGPSFIFVSLGILG